MRPRLALSLLAALLVSASAQAATVYSEVVQGDLSNNGLAPTTLTFAPGSNQVLGVTGRSTAVDRDYFTIIVPAGYRIDQIVELAGTQAGGVSFFGIQAGPQITLPVSATTADGLLGWTHYASVSANTNLLPALSVPDTGSTGFSALNAGQYSFWIQDFTAGTYTYAFDIQLTQTPEPASSALCLVASLLLASAAYRHSKMKLS